ncbi:MAG TPA: hypothetical protein VK658_15550 [Chryseolinea sp.]|nr:hypothetical protein [Chryseolinea sp.]
MMKNIFTLLVIAMMAFSCSDDSSEDRVQVPFEGEYHPVSFAIGSGGTEYLVNDCTNDLREFSGELEEYILGNLTIGRLNADCQSCGEFSGPYSWSSRCDATYHNGIWKTTEYGATMSFRPDFSTDSTLNFTAASPVGYWKLRFDKGEEFIVINYTMKRN